MKRLIAASVLIALSPASALAASHFLKVSPGTVKAGKAVTVHGSVDHGCQTPGQVTIFSQAFKGATHQDFAGVPAVFVTASGTGAFSKKVVIRRNVKPGHYTLGGRCGGGNFGSATLNVT